MSTNESQAKRKKGIETTKRILTASSELFSRYGYDNVSVRDIAKEVGIKESSLYNHFASKQEILENLFGIFAESVPAARPKADEMDHLLDILTPEEILKNTIIDYGKSIDGIIGYTARIIYTEMYRNQRAASIYKNVVVEEPTAFYESLIQKMMDKGVLKKADARLTAEVFYDAIIALTIEFSLAKDQPSEVTAAVKKMMRTAEFICSVLKP